MSTEFPNQNTISEALLEFLRSNILAEGVSVDETTELSQLGVDSVSLVELLLFIERRFNVVVPEQDLTADNLATIGALSECVQGHINSSSSSSSADGDKPKEQ